MQMLENRRWAITRFGPSLIAVCAVGLLSLTTPQGSWAQGAGERVEMSVEPEFPLYTSVLGPLTRGITTESAAAQAYFTQGLQMMYAFTLPAGVASFEEAQRQDPECAMCYFGEAWARGPYLNGEMQASNAPEAFEAIQRALDLSEESATPVERALIEAMSLRYTEEEDEDLRPPAGFSVRAGDGGALPGLPRRFGRRNLLCGVSDAPGSETGTVSARRSCGSGLP